MKLFILTFAFFLSTFAAAQMTHEQKLVRGKYLFNASGCMNCHTPDRNKPLAGGLKMDTDFGSFYTPNITPDKTNGIGSWTEEDFLIAMKKGISPKGKYYYPSFVFTAYTKLTKEDTLAIWEYLKTFAPYPDKNKEHELKFPMNNRKLLLGWRALNFKTDLVTDDEERVFKYAGTFRPRKDKSQSWNNGAYLVEAAFHCTECHTPRNKLGGLQADKWMSGAIIAGEEEPAGNITSDKQTGLGNWSKEDWKTFLTEGTKPDGVDVGGEMYKYIKYGTSKLTEQDLNDVIEYLQSLKPINHSVHK